VVVTAASSSYKGHRYPGEIIAHCVWLYFRFSLSFREVEDTVPPEVRAARRKVTPHRHPRRNERNERAKTGVATRSQASPVPQPA
jgi:transposase-like protein